MALVPARPLSTAAARAALPGTVPHADAVFNLGRMGLLIAGLADRRRCPEAGEDRLHQDPAVLALPGGPALLAGLRPGRALTSCWSGAGPTILAVWTARTLQGVARAAERLLAPGRRGRPR